MEGVGQAVPTHAVAAVGRLFFTLDHGVERLEAGFQIGHIGQEVQNHAFHFDTRVEHVLHFLQIGNMNERAAIGLQINDFVVCQQGQRAAHGIARANHLAAKLGFGQFFAGQQNMVGNAVQNQGVNAEQLRIMPAWRHHGRRGRRMEGIVIGIHYLSSPHSLACHIV